MPTVRATVIALPIADRPRALAFYRDALGLEPFGPPGDDGIPEPLQLRLDERTSLMLVPTGGFGWVLGGREAAAPNVSECVLGLEVSSEREVTELLARFPGAGGAVLVEPTREPWGFSGLGTDPDGHAWQITASEPAAGSPPVA